MDNEYNSVLEKYDKIVESYEKLIKDQNEVSEVNRNLILRLGEMSDKQHFRFMVCASLSLFTNLILLLLYIKK